MIHGCILKLYGPLILCSMLFATAGASNAGITSTFAAKIGSISDTEKEKAEECIRGLNADNFDPRLNRLQKGESAKKYESGYIRPSDTGEEGEGPGYFSMRDIYKKLENPESRASLDDSRKIHYWNRTVLSFDLIMKAFYMLVVRKTHKKAAADAAIGLWGKIPNLRYGTASYAATNRWKGSHSSTHTEFIMIYDILQEKFDTNIAVSHSDRIDKLAQKEADCQKRKGVAEEAVSKFEEDLSKMEEECRRLKKEKDRFTEEKAILKKEWIGTKENWERLEIIKEELRSKKKGLSSTYKKQGKIKQALSEQYKELKIISDELSTISGEKDKIADLIYNEQSKNGSAFNSAIESLTKNPSLLPDTIYSVKAMCPVCEIFLTSLYQLCKKKAKFISSTNNYSSPSTDYGTYLKKVFLNNTPALAVQPPPPPQAETQVAAALVVPVQTV